MNGDIDNNFLKSLFNDDGTKNPDKYSNKSEFQQLKFGFFLIQLYLKN